MPNASIAGKSGVRSVIPNYVSTSQYFSKTTLRQDGRSGPYCPYRVFHIAPYAGQNVFFQEKKESIFSQNL